MINTNYSNLNNGNYGAMNLAVQDRNEQADGHASAQMFVSNASDTGVLLTLSSSSVLQKGSQGDEVKKLQQDLTTLGYDTKGTDGIFGDNTEKAVTAFQKAYSLAVDGKAGPATQSAIAKALDYHNKGILTVGSRGTKVSDLQRNLTKLGYDTKGTDGIFGSNTKSAVMAFQKDHGLAQDGMAGKDTLNAINKAIESLGTGQTPPSSNPANIQKMLDNIKNDTSLGLSADKKTAMYMAAERLLNDGYEVEFVAGILGNIQNEGTPGKFESSNYSNPNKKPAYLKYMDEHFDYRNKFSGKSITEVGISATIQLQNSAAASGYAGKFGLGMIQWTGSRTGKLLQAYQKYATSDKPTKEECIKAEVNFMADELKGDYARVYTNWKAGDKTASSAGDIVCRQYEIPGDTANQARIRAQNASKIYEVMMK